MLYLRTIYRLFKNSDRKLVKYSCSAKDEFKAISELRERYPNFIFSHSKPTAIEKSKERNYKKRMKIYYAKVKKNRKESK